MGSRAISGRVLQAKDLWQFYGRVAALRGTDFELLPGEILAVIGDNGAGKSSLIKCLSGAAVPDEGEILLDGERVRFRTPQQAKAAGIETVYQTLAVAPALDIASNMYLGREIRRSGPLGSSSGSSTPPGCATRRRTRSRRWASRRCRTSLRRSRRCPAASARLSPWPGPPPSAARWSSSTSRPPRSACASPARSIDLIKRLRDSGMPVVLISHDMPSVFELADRIHVQRLGKRVAVISPATHSMDDAVAIMTGARAA